MHKKRCIVEDVDVDMLWTMTQTYVLLILYREPWLIHDEH